MDSKKEIDISTVDFKLDAKRLDKELFALDEPMSSKIPKLEANYGTFFKRYTEDMLNLGAIGDPTLPSAYKQFVYDTDINKVAKDVSKSYPDLSNENSEIENGFKRYSVLFPEKTIPSIVYIIYGFTYKIATTEKTIGIGLDMYMGASYSYYNALQFPEFRKQTMERVFIPTDVLKGWITTEFEKPDSGKTFLDEIIYEGKMLYLLDLLLPNTPDEIKIGYTKNQLQWCQQNEMAMWGHFVNEKLLFSKIKGEYFKFINPGPFTAGFDRKSPARTGIWLGWQIVKSYMESNPETPILDLIKNNDAQGILNSSNYKPKK